MNVYEELETYKPMVERMARGMCRTNGRLNWEDLAQEAYVAVWKLLDSGETRKGYLLRAAKNRMVTAMTDAKLFYRKGAVHRIEENSTKDLVSSYGDNRTGTDNVVWQDFDAVQDIENTEFAYHAGEIAAAINALTPNQRKYVLMRFYEGKTHAEIEAAWGYNPGSVWSDKKHGARKRLSESLGHLKELAHVR